MQNGVRYEESIFRSGHKEEQKNIADFLATRPGVLSPETLPEKLPVQGELSQLL